MLSRAAAPMRPNPQPAPMMATPAPMPAPTLAPDRVALLGAWAIAGETASSNTTTTRASSCRVFMGAPGPRSRKRPCFTANTGRPARPAGSVLRVQAHAHEQGGQEDEDVRLQERHEQFHQAQGDHAQ